MTLRVDAPATERLSRTSRSAATVVTCHTARRAIRSALLWGYVFGVAIASSEISYIKIYKTMPQRQALAATYGANTAISAIFGPTRHLQTVSGFTVFKISMTLMILGGVWGILTSTRLMRGEEESGRWDIFVAGQTTRRGATAQAIAGLGAGVLTLWVVTAVISVLSGHISSVGIAAGASLYLALAVVASPLMFLAVGAVAGQLAATRRQAALFGSVALGVSYAIRLIADAGLGLHGLIWATPLGWVEELQPLNSPRPFALVPIIGLSLGLAGIAVHISGNRDVGASILADRVQAEPRLTLLTGSTGLAVRLIRATVMSWWVAIAVSALLYGLIAKSAGTTISGSIKEVFSKFGATGTGAGAILGVCFLIEAVLIGFVAAGQITAARAEESDGKLDHFLSGAVSRPWWLGGRLVLAVLVLLSCGVVAGTFAWLGAASQHSGLSSSTLLGAGANLVPPALVVLGLGVLMFGVRPRLTAPVVYSFLGWSLFVVLVGGIGAMNHWVLDTSVFHQMASAPAVRPNWEANAWMTIIGAVTALAGCVAFRRRDLQGP